MTIDAPVTSVTTRWAPSHRVDLRQTLRPLGRGSMDPTTRWAGLTSGAASASAPSAPSSSAASPSVWRTMRAPTGPATLHLTVRDSAVEATAWGPGAEWAIEHTPELLGDGDDAEGFDVTGNPFLHEAHRRLHGIRLLRTNLVFEAIFPAILEQKVTGKEARHAWRWLMLKHGEAAPGPAPEGMRVCPSPHQVRAIPSWDWHAAGVGPQRSRTVLAAASVALGLERTLALGRGSDEITRKVRTVPGVGVWTAAETTQRSHGDPDSVSVGDYHLPALVGWALIGKPVDDDGMLELLEPWRGHRQRVMRLIEGSGFAKPRFGPRMTVQDHRGH